MIIKPKPTMIIKCSGCRKKLEVIISSWKSKKARGQHDFYHRECFVKTSVHKNFVRGNYGY